MKKNLLIRSLGACLSLFLLGCAQPAATDATDEIRQANEEFIAAMNANDAARLAAVYTNDGMLYPPNGEPVSGQEAIADFWQAVFDMGVARGELTTKKAMAMGDMAVEEGAFAIFAEDGSAIDNGNYVVIWKKVDGTWKYHRDIWNSNNPLPEPEPEPEPAKPNVSFQKQKKSAG